MFIQSQSQWVVTLLQDVHFFSEDGYSNLWGIVHELEEHRHLLAVSGDVRVDPRVEFTLDNWDGQTLCSNPDFLRDKRGLTSEVPFFCSNFNSKRSSNSTNLLIHSPSLHSIAGLCSFV
jgi:hypothetical protein